jgi:hypothetical protein
MAVNGRIYASASPLASVDQLHKHSERRGTKWAISTNLKGKLGPGVPGVQSIAPDDLTVGGGNKKFWSPFWSPSWHHAPGVCLAPRHRWSCIQLEG